MTVKCCVCNKTRIADRWLVNISEAAPDDTVSHSYCPSCLHAALSEVDTMGRMANGNTPSLPQASSTLRAF